MKFLAFKPVAPLSINGLILLANIFIALAIFAHFIAFWAFKIVYGITVGWFQIVIFIVRGWA